MAERVIPPLEKFKVETPTFESDDYTDFRFMCAEVEWELNSGTVSSEDDMGERLAGLNELCPFMNQDVLVTGMVEGGVIGIESDEECEGTVIIDDDEKVKFQVNDQPFRMIGLELGEQTRADYVDHEVARTYLPIELLFVRSVQVHLDDGHILQAWQQIRAAYDDIELKHQQQPFEQMVQELKELFPREFDELQAVLDASTDEIEVLKGIADIQYSVSTLDDPHMDEAYLNEHLDFDSIVKFTDYVDGQIKYDDNPYCVLLKAGSLMYELDKEDKREAKIIEKTTIRMVSPKCLTMAKFRKVVVDPETDQQRVDVEEHSLEYVWVVDVSCPDPDMDKAHVWIPLTSCEEIHRVRDLVYSAHIT